MAAKGHARLPNARSADKARREVALCASRALVTALRSYLRGQAGLQSVIDALQEADGLLERAGFGVVPF